MSIPTDFKLPATLIGICGPSGVGKSTALRNLPQDISRIFDIERKGMPFKVTNPEFVIPVADWNDFQVKIRKVESDPAIRIVGIDSATALFEYNQVQCEKDYKGFEIWKVYNDNIASTLSRLKSKGKTVIITSLEEIVQIQGLDGQNTTRRRMFVQGKEWANKGIESECLAVWTAFAKRSADKSTIEYMLATQTDGVTLAKTPPFWGLGAQVPNDVWAALQTISKNL